MKFVYIALTLVFTVYGQLMVKSRALVHAGNSASDNKWSYIITMFTDIGVVSGLAAAVLASLFWMLAIQKTSLSFAYPFMALSFVLVPVAGALLFHEPFSPIRFLSLALIVGGIAVSAWA